MSGQIRKAVIRRIAENRHIPLAAAAHAYACMPIAKKTALCAAEERRAPATSAALSQEHPHG